MDVRSLFVILAVFFVAGCSAQGNDPTMTIDGASEYRKDPGESLYFTCTLDQPIQILMGYDVMWIHISEYDPENVKETELTKKGTVSAGGDPERMKVDVVYDTNSPVITYSLNITQVKSSDEGKYVCRAKPMGGSDTLEKSVELIIESEVEYVEMTFDGEGPIRGADQMKVTRDQGSYDVTCTAGGFSTGAVIHLFKGDEHLNAEMGEAVEDLDASMKDQAVRRKITATIPALELTGSDSGKKLRCQAKANHKPSTQTVEASVTLNIILLEPTITCDKNVSAHVKDMYVKVKCIVDHKGIDIDNFSWTIGNGKSIFPGDVTEEHDVTVKKKEEGVSEVSLEINMVDSSHFSKVLYLDVHTKSGQKFREQAQLFELPTSSSDRPNSVSGPTSGAASVPTSNAVYMASFWQLLVFSLGLLLSRQ